MVINIGWIILRNACEMGICHCYPTSSATSSTRPYSNSTNPAFLHQTDGLEVPLEVATCTPPSLQELDPLLSASKAPLSLQTCDNCFSFFPLFICLEPVVLLPRSIQV